MRTRTQQLISDAQECFTYVTRFFGEFKYKPANLYFRCHILKKEDGTVVTINVIYEMNINNDQSNHNGVRIINDNYNSLLETRATILFSCKEQPVHRKIIGYSSFLK